MASNPFYFGGRISTPDQFVGREDAIRFIIQRMIGPQMTSVAVVGEHRIGKSSLLHHIYQTYPQRIEDWPRFLVAEVSLQEAQVRDRAGFVSTVSERLQRAYNSHLQPDRLPAWSLAHHDVAELGNQLRQLYEADLRVVVCLDEFEELLEHREAFNNTFYDGLRALLDAQHLMLVIASTQPLTYYGQRYQLVSRFFNLTNSLTLGELTQAEAQTLLSRPAAFGENRPALGAMDSQLALRLGRRHPFFLQMAAYYVFEAQMQRHDEAWIQRQFDAQARQHYSSWQRHRRSVLRGILRGPAWLGRIVVAVGMRQDDVGNIMVGFAVVVVVILALFGWLPIAPLWEWLKGLLGFGASS